MSSVDNALARRLFDADASYMLPESSFNKRINSQAPVYKDQPMSQAQLERLAVNSTPADIRAQMMAVLSDPKGPIYYDGFVFHGVNGLTIAEAFDKVCKIATDVILTKAPRMPYRTAQFMAREFVKLFPDFAMKDLPNNINYGSKEWAKMRTGFSYGKKEGAERSGEPRSEPPGKQGQSVDGLSTAQLLTLGDAALKANANWGEKLLLFMAAAMGRLDLGALDTIAPLELKKILTRTATDAFADDLAKAALFNKLVEDHKILSSLQKNLPTLPSPHTDTEYAAYDSAFSTYRDRFAGLVKEIFENKTALLPVWAQTEIRGGRARTVPLRMGINYQQNGVTRVSQKYHYDQPGVVPFFLQIVHEGKERFVLYTLDAIAPELVPEGMGLQEFMTKLDINAFFPKAWVKQKIQETMVNETRSNAFNRREMPWGRNIALIPFIEPSTGHTKGFQDIGLDLENQVRSLIQETHKKTYYQDRNDQFATFLQPLVALMPSSGELSSFAEGNVRGALISLLGDLLLLFGVGAVSKALESGALASLVGNGADFVEKLVGDTVEKIRPAKPNPAAPDLIPLIDMGTEETSLETLWGEEGGSAQVGQKPSPSPSSSDSIPLIDMGTEETSLESLWGSEGGTTGTFTDANNQTSTAIFRLKPGEKASDPDALYGIFDDNTKKISPQNYLKNSSSNHFVQAGLKGGAPGEKLVLTVNEVLDYRQPAPSWNNLERIGPAEVFLFQDKTNGRFYYREMKKRGGYYEIFQNDGSQIFRPGESKNWYIPHPDNAAPRIWLELKDEGFVRANPPSAVSGAPLIGGAGIGLPAPKHVMGLTAEELATYQTNFPEIPTIPTAFHSEGFARDVTFLKIPGHAFYIDGDGNVFEMMATEDGSIWIIKNDAPPLRVIADENGYPSVVRNASPSPTPDQAGGSGIHTGQEFLNTPEVQFFLKRKTQNTVAYLNAAWERGRISNINFVENHKKTVSMQGLVAYKGKIYKFVFGASPDATVSITDPITGELMDFPGGTFKRQNGISANYFWKTIATDTDPLPQWSIAQGPRPPIIDTGRKELNALAQAFLLGKTPSVRNSINASWQRGRISNLDFVKNHKETISMRGLVAYGGKIYGFTSGSSESAVVSITDPVTGRPVAFPAGGLNSNEVSAYVFWRAIATDTVPLPP